ncbi:MAG: hypothetical protein HOH29_03700 [Cellvibrionales bacterium]|nr:hypothetical protein [Cellvibrionales bacterium]
MFAIKCYKRTALLLLSLSLSVTGHVFAADWYVSAAGSNNNSGSSESSPYQTINRGITQASAGDTIYVMDGTYRNANFDTNKQLGVNPSNLSKGAVVNFNKSGTAGNPITLRNLEGHSPKIEFDGSGGINVSNGTSHIIIEGFEIEGPSQFIDYDQAIANRNYKILVAEDNDPNTSFGRNYFAGKGIWGYGVHSHVIVRNNVVYNTPGSAIRFNDADYATIEYNEVYNTTWWTTSASSAIVYAETISAAGDNGTEIKMIMRGNVVYNSWNRIPFYVTQLPDNANGPGGNYGTASQNNILDGQGLYVTRSDPGYAGTFLFENNLLVNNGKNGINFDHSEAARAIYRNNTLYFNGVHDIIQDLSVAAGNPRHVGSNKVAGIKANDVFAVEVANNIIVTRNDQYSALSLVNVIGSKSTSNNIFVNGTFNQSNASDQINVDPLFINAPAVVNGAINMSGLDFSVDGTSPAINAGNSSYTPDNDIDGVARPVLPESIVAASSFESSLDGWNGFGSTVASSSAEAKTGVNSIYTSNRAFNYSSPRFYLNGLLTVGETYSISVWVKLAANVSGTTRISIKRTLAGVASYSNSSEVTASNANWEQLTWDYTHSASDDTFLYVKGPANPASGKEFYIDDFSIVPQGSASVDFASIGDVVDIGAYEFKDSGQDADADSINDDLDNCPNTPNSDQLNLDNDSFGDACDDDIDGDTVLNVNDNCPSVANTDQQDSDNDLTGNACDSTPNGDTDLDTIDNATDNCPAVANTDQNDIDQDNLGDVCDLDIDGDGVPNAIELAVGTNPSNANDAAQAAQAVIDGLNNGGTGDVEEVQIPMIGGAGLLVLGLSMLGMGALRARKK